MANGTTTIDRTFGTPTNNIKWTWSGWVKPSMAQEQGLFHGYVDANNYAHIGLSSTNQLQLYNHVSGSASGNIKTNRVLRDCSAFYHIVVVFDSAVSEATDRIKVYVNNVRETSLGNAVSPGINTASKINGAWSHKVGAKLGSYDFSGVMSHVNFCDGQAYAPSDFGETDATDGMWKIKTSPSVTYGNNGFFLKLEDSSNLDLDSSGNSHTFTTTGTLTATKDNPDNNFATLNSLTKDAGGAKTYANGNNTVTETANSWTSAHSSLEASTGKYYCETKLISFSGGSASYIGAASGDEIGLKSNVTYWIGSGTGSIGYYAPDGKVAKAGSDAAFGATWGAGDIIGTALDLDNNFIYFSKNGVWQNSGDPTSGSSGTGGVALPSGMTGGELIGFSVSPNESVMAVNFGNGYFQTTAITSAGTNASGNGTFEYDVPTGFTALCTKGINS